MVAQLNLLNCKPRRCPLGLIDRLRIEVLCLLRLFMENLAVLLEARKQLVRTRWFHLNKARELLLSPGLTFPSIFFLSYWDYTAIPLFMTSIRRQDPKNFPDVEKRGFLLRQLAVSLFGLIWWDEKYWWSPKSIRRQDPKNFSDVEKIGLLLTCCLALPRGNNLPLFYFINKFLLLLLLPLIAQKAITYLSAISSIIFVVVVSKSYQQPYNHLRSVDQKVIPLISIHI